MTRPVSIFINAILVVIQTNSFQASSRLEERGTASFVVKDLTGSGSYSQDMTVEVYEGEIGVPSGTPIYAGFIDSVEASPIGVSNGLFHRINCKDNHYLADKRLVVKTYTSKTLAYIVNDILTDYLADEGITAGTIQTGPTIETVIFNLVNVTQCFDALKEYSGFTWRINHDKSLDFMDRVTNTAPWALTGAHVEQGTARRLGGNAAYRNRQYVRGGTGITSQQTETRTSDGNTLAFTMGFPLALEPTVTFNGVPQSVGIKGVDTGKDCYWNKGDATITFDSVAGTSGHSIVVVYYGQYPLIALSESQSSMAATKALEGGSGIVENVVTETQHESSASISASARGKITQYCQNAEKFSFVTRTSGLEAAQMLTVTFAPFGYTAVEMLIESVSITEFGNQLSYSVTVITGPVLGSWTKLFSRILERQDKTIKVGDSRLLILLQQSETLALTEATSLDEDEFGVSGNVNRWLNSPPIDAGALHNLQHERLELTEDEAIDATPTEDYEWDGLGIDVGNPVVNRASTGNANYTRIDLNNPSLSKGKIDTVKIFAATTTMLGTRVGVFYAVGGGVYACRSAVLIGDVTHGSEQTFTGLDLECEIGDFIGLFFSTGYIEKDTSGGAGYAYKIGNYVTVGSSETYTNSANQIMSIRGTGLPVSWDFATWA